MEAIRLHVKENWTYRQITLTWEYKIRFGWSVECVNRENGWIGSVGSAGRASPICESEPLRLTAPAGKRTAKKWWGNLGGGRESQPN